MVVDASLTTGQKLAQSLHGFRDFQQRHPIIETEWHHDSNFICVLQASAEQLQELLMQAKNQDIRTGWFHEEDLNNQLTCVVLEPGPDTKRLTRPFKLAC